MKKRIHELMVDQMISNLGQNAPSFAEACEKTVEMLIKKDKLEKSVGMGGLFLGPDYFEKNKLELLPLFYANNHGLAFLYMTYYILQEGNNIFVLNNDIAEALYESHVSIKVEDISFPFEAFSIYVEDSNLTNFNISHKKDGPELVEHKIDALHVRMRKVDGLLKVQFVCGYRDEVTDDELNDWSNTTIISYTMGLEGELDAFRKETERNILSSQELPKEWEELLVRENKKLLNFVYSMILYINTKKDIKVYTNRKELDQLREIKNPKKKKRREKEVSDLSRGVIRYVGVNYRMVEKNTSTERKGGTPLKYTVTVRGHWRYQWYGSKMNAEGQKQAGDYQKIVWIEPYRKGTDKAPPSRIEWRVR